MTALDQVIDYPARDMTITVQAGYDEPWLPDLAGTTGFGFAGVSSADGSGAACPASG